MFPAYVADAAVASSDSIKTSLVNGLSTFFR